MVYIVAELKPEVVRLIFTLLYIYLIKFFLYEYKLR